MKNSLFIIGISVMFASCGSSIGDADSTTDSTCVTTCDSTIAVDNCDTCDAIVVADTIFMK